MNIKKVIDTILLISSIIFCVYNVAMAIYKINNHHNEPGKISIPILFIEEEAGVDYQENFLETEF